MKRVILIVALILSIATVVQARECVEWKDPIYIGEVLFTETICSWGNCYQNVTWKKFEELDDKIGKYVKIHGWWRTRKEVIFYEDYDAKTKKMDKFKKKIEKRNKE